LPPEAEAALTAYYWLGSGFCRDVPAAGLLALDLIRPTFASNEAARSWFENLMLIHGYTTQIAQRRAERRRPTR
jgi:hypothetical protein